MSLQDTLLNLALSGKTILLLDIGDKFPGWPGMYPWGHKPKVAVTKDNQLKPEEFAALMNVACVPGPDIDAEGLLKLFEGLLKHPGGPPHILVIVNKPEDAVIPQEVIDWTHDKEVRLETIS